MPKVVIVPRINANEDEVVIKTFMVEVGQKVQKGDSLFEVESDKAIIAIDAGHGGFILKLNCEVGDRIAVGQPVVWIGESMKDDIPKTKPQIEGKTNTSIEAPTLKALVLLREAGLSPVGIPFEGERLTASDVEKYLQNNSEIISNKIQLLESSETTMLRTVSWQKEEAVSAYLETYIDQHSWDKFAKNIQDKFKLFFDPLLGILAFQVVRAAKEYPLINACLSKDKKLFHHQINLGFTLNVKDKLYLIVVRDAGNLELKEFLEDLMDLQKKAFKNRLTINETTGATVCFSSLANTGIHRHIPILAPLTSLMVAHSVPQLQPVIKDIEKMGVVGVSYDHRILTGNYVSQILKYIFETPKD